MYIYISEGIFLLICQIFNLWHLAILLLRVIDHALYINICFILPNLALENYPLAISLEYIHVHCRIKDIHVHVHASHLSRVLLHLHVHMYRGDSAITRSRYYGNFSDITQCCFEF